MHQQQLNLCIVRLVAFLHQLQLVPISSGGRFESLTMGAGRHTILRASGEGQGVVCVAFMHNSKVDSCFANVDSVDFLFELVVSDTRVMLNVKQTKQYARPNPAFKVCPHHPQVQVQCMFGAVVLYPLHFQSIHPSQMLACSTLA